MAAFPENHSWVTSWRHQASQITLPVITGYRTRLRPAFAHDTRWQAGQRRWLRVTADFPNDHRWRFTVMGSAPSHQSSITSQCVALTATSLLVMMGRWANMRIGVKVRRQIERLSFSYDVYLVMCNHQKKYFTKAYFRFYQFLATYPTAIYLIIR